MAKTSRTCGPNCPGMFTGSMFLSIIILFLCILVNPCHSIRFLGDRETYARYPRWDACISASIAFEFRTTQKNGLLMYTDDNGKYDYLQVAISDGAIRLWINFVVEEQQRVEIELGHNLNDGQWHRVEVKRNRMETRLLVDKTQSSKVTFGSDFRFGEELASNNYMYFGGVPSNYVQNLARLDIPASVLNTPFQGEMRNILYFNCSCIPVRAAVIDGRGYDASYTEACEQRDPCPSDCPCFSTNDGPACECAYKQECMKDLLAHYQLPMDRLDRDLIVNPSGLDSRVYGGPELVHGVHNNALKLDGRSQWIHVSGPSHKGECFGDLERCQKGYYVGMWTQFQRADGQKSVYMSNGGHLSNGHGIAMSYSSAGLEFVFKTKGGKEWKVNHRDVQPGKWYHVAASWTADKGLYLYINGHLVAHEQTPRQTSLTRDDGPYKDFVIGRSNDHSGTHQLGTVMVDDFSFMSEYKSEEDIRELGPTFKCDLPMDHIRGTSLEATGCVANIHGQIQTYPARVGQGIIFSDYEGYVDLGEASGKCLGDLDRCKHGFYISFYVKFNRLDNKNSYIFSSPHGMEIYQIGSQLVALAQRDRSVWEARYNGLDPGTWYFVEVSWSPSDGISLYVDGLEVDRQIRESSVRERRSTSEKRVFIGRSNIDGRSEKLSNAMLDEMDIFYATRDELSRIGTISTDQVITRRIIFNGFRNNVLRTIDREIRGYGDLELGIGKGQDMRAIYLLGRTGYLDLGSNFTCGGNLELCRQGVTLRIGIRPTTLQDNVVYWDSFPVRLFYRDGQLYGQFQTATQLWTVRTPHFRPEQWQRVELSWHPVQGLTMYIDGQRVDHQGNPVQQPYRTTTDWRTFFGRSLQDGQPHAHVAVDNIEVWTTYGGGVPDDDYIKIITPRPTYRPPTWTEFPIDKGNITLIGEVGRITTQYPYYTERPPYTQAPPDNGRIKIIQFNGNSFVHFNFNRLPPDFFRPADSEVFQFNFLANEPNGLIWLHEDPNRKMYLALKDGQLIFVNDDGTRTPDEIVIGKRDRVRFDDRRWHSFKITRRGRRINLSVDERHHEDYIFAQDVQFLVPAEVYLGGTQSTYSSTKNRVHHNFQGGLAQVLYTTETRHINGSFRNEVNLIAQIENNNPNVVIDNIDWPPDVHHTVPTVGTKRTTPAPPLTKPPPPRITAITIRDDRIYLTVTEFWLQAGSTLTFKFQTVKREALLMYATSNIYGRNFIALEIYDGRLYLIHNFGGHTKRTLFSEVDVSDGRPHEVELRFLEKQLVLSLDRETERVAIEGNEQIPRSLGPLYIGGFTSFETLPWHTWARTGYQGCIEDLRINGKIIDLHSYILSPQQLGAVERHCATMHQQCSALSPCVRGKCTNKWGGYYCDCSATNYTGDRCHIPSLTGAFNGNTHIKSSFFPQRKYHVDDISFRFRTFISDGLFFQTKAGTDSGFLRAELEGGRVKVTTNLGGDQKVFYAGENLNDYQWHTVYIQRRGNHLILWVDDLDKQKYILPGQDYHLYVGDIFIGGYRREELHLPSSIKNYTGYLQNLYIGGVDIFQQDNNATGNFYHENYILLLEFRSVTFTNFNSFVQLPSLGSLSGLSIYFLFRTHDPNGVILFSEGRNKELFVVELHDGKLHMKLDIPGKPRLHVTTPDNPRFNDGKWHLVSISHQKIGGQDQLNMAVDGLRSSHSFSGIDQLSLQEALFVGGLPDATFQKQYVKDFLASRTGFRGCLASLTVNGNSPDLYKAGQGSGIADTCQEINKSQCTKFVCSNGGICYDHVHNGTIWCDCSKTGYEGQYCKDEPVGYYFRKQGNADLYGMMVYHYLPLEMNDSSVDEIVFGVMTTEKNAVLTRLISGVLDEFIEIKLVNGYPVVTYDTDGHGASTTITSDVFVSDNKYHIIRFVRTKDNGTLYVDSRANINTHIVPHTNFDRLGKIFIGGAYQGGKIVDGSGFHGIIGGLNVNGHLIFPNAEHDVRVKRIQDIEVAPHPFKVYPLIVTPIITTQAPITVTAPPVPVLPILPHDIGGGGVGWSGEAGPGGTGISVWLFPDGGSGGSVLVPGSLAPVGEGAALAQVVPVSSMPATGPRAGAVMGTILGLAALASSLMWAFYRCKPGWCTCLKAPAAVPLNIVHRAGAGSGAAGGGAGSVKTTAVNGSQAQAVAGAGGGAAGGAGGGGAYYYSQQSSSGGGGGLQTDSYDSATLRATGTFSNRGTAIGTPRTGRHQFASQSSTSGFESSGGVIGASAGSGGGTAFQSYQFEAGNTHADYDVASGVHSNYQSNTLTSGGVGGGGGGFSTSTMSSNYNYSVKTIQTVGGQQQMMGYISGSTSNVLMTPGAMGEEIRVDCCLMTRDGHSVVTGSSLGPPQVWNMSNGELLRIMQGETVGSTNLHLVCNDRLLVGAINADLEINQYSVPKGVHNYIFQIWDFASGRPLGMTDHETCSALTVMSDNEKVVFGRSDKFGGGTNIVVWDLLGNQPVKEMRFDAPVGNNDYISHLSLSQNDRYIIAGFTNTFDNFAEFVVFDMTLTSYNITDPNILRLDAAPECTAILPRDEAVTGLRNGDLVVWSLRTGQPNRQLLANNGKHAHFREVKAVARSEDSKFLVSGSADGTLKVWDLESERHICTMSGHTDEVWCTAVSSDNEIVVSGSRDGTIRLWQLRTGKEICTFNAGVDVFYITMSRDKGTIVALGDKFGARKLIMLQVVRSKVKRQVLA